MALLSVADYAFYLPDATPAKKNGSSTRHWR